MRTLAKTVYTSSQFVLTVLFLLCVSISMLFAEFSANDTWYREYRESGPYISVSFIVFCFVLLISHQYISKSLVCVLKTRHAELIGFEKTFSDIVAQEGDVRQFLRDMFQKFSNEKGFQILIAYQVIGIVQSQQFLEEIIPKLYHELEEDVIQVFCNGWWVYESDDELSLERFFNRRMTSQGTLRLNSLLLDLNEYVLIARKGPDGSNRCYGIGVKFIQYLRKNTSDPNFAYGVVSAAERNFTQWKEYLPDVCLEDFELLGQGILSQKFLV